MSAFPHLLSPGRIGSLELKNRLLQTAMGTNLANQDGTISEDTIGFYAARAAGGTAMQIMGTLGGLSAGPPAGGADLHRR